MKYHKLECCHSCYKIVVRDWVYDSTISYANLFKIFFAVGKR